MPAIKSRLVRQLKAKGMSEAHAQATAQNVLKKSGNVTSSGRATAKGKKRGKMGASGRAKDRAAKDSKGKYKASDYTYNPQTNRATLDRVRSKRK